MASRYKIGGSRTTTDTSGASQEKALASVDVQSDDSGGGGFVLDFMGGDDADRELTQQQVYRKYHKSAILQMAVAPIVRTVGEIVYKWQDDNEPSEFDLERPNRWHQSAEHFGLCAAYLLLGGEYVAIKNETARGDELWPIPADDVEEPETRSQQWTLEDGSVLGLSRTDFDRDELLIIQQPDLTNPYMHGRGAGQAIGHDIDIDEAAAEHTATYLENHAKPDSIIGVEGASRDDIDRFLDSMRQKHGGPGNSGKLEAFAGDVSIETMMHPFGDLGTTDLRADARKVARTVFGVPPVMTGQVEDVNRNTAETQEVVFKKHVIRPLVRKIIEAHNEQFVRPDLGEQYGITTGEIVPDDKRFRQRAMEENPQAYLVNEQRQLTGHEPLDDERGDQTLLEAEVDAMGPGGGAGAQQRDHQPPQKKITSLVVKQNEEQIDRVLDAVNAEDMDELRTRFEQAMEGEARQTMDSIGESFGGGVLTAAVEAKVDERFEWVLPDIAGVTREKLRDLIVEGLDEGINPRDVASQMQDKFDEFEQVRATRIARTEMLSASNAGTYAAHQESDVVEKRSWLSTRDGNVRPAHVDLDGTVVAVDEPFTYEGDTAMHPGDFSRADLVVNCRCTTVAEFPGQNRSEAERDKIWRRFVKRLDEEERRTQQVVAAAFARQRDRVLDRFSDAFDVELAA